ncbi:YCF48-related protein [Hymenobacter sp. 5516J-16]|uniref:VPS10 domain-containing protein n=1 Tax=Hymenobacter sp. 5516J-16 TaxID=2932253 RepID=UPI001FD5D92A|nr:YCF48-related protein [Hymenobacter sp. 5516J-16]UOQ79179.1 YCF48-related protein [Hymenobacter sp. 5516J-16]
MVSGFIQDKGEQDFVYWSDNHGASWRKVTFGKSSWIDACYATPTGKAWMSGSSQLIYYTEDSGRSWREFNKVESTGNLRFSTIHFAPDEKTGLFGSHWNVLYRTTDNCRTWEKLPTPLSQNKYRKLSKEQRPEVRKARIFGKYYLLNQEGKVFITPSNHVDWQRLPEVIDFEVSPAGHLYTVRKDLTIQLYQQDFSPIWHSTQPLDQAPHALFVRNEKLFAVTHDKVYRIEPTQFTAARLLTNQVDIPDPELTIRYHGAEYGVDGQDIVRYDKASKRWARFLTAPFPIATAALFNGQLLVADQPLTNYFRVDEQRKVLLPFTLPASLFGQQANAVAEFHVERGSQGCFHADNSRRSFTRKGNQFELMTQKKTECFPAENG